MTVSLAATIVGSIAATKSGAREHDQRGAFLRSIAHLAVTAPAGTVYGSQGAIHRLPPSEVR